MNRKTAATLAGPERASSWLWARSSLVALLACALSAALAPQEAMAATCGDSVVQGGEDCDGGVCCTELCTFKSIGASCRPSIGSCDLEETCTGASATCPADVLRGAGELCRDLAGPCDSQEVCTGASAACPADEFLDTSNECRASAGDCDPAETCTGSSALCPANAFSPGTEVCNASTGPCDPAEYCPGDDVDCPDDELSDDTVICRPADGACDAPDYCDGFDAECPEDELLDGDVCRPLQCADENYCCDIEEECDGLSKDCPADEVEDAEWECRFEEDDCDVTEFCDGINPECPADARKAEGAVCRGKSGECDKVERCDGVSIECPADEVRDAGKRCRASSGDCDIEETCDGVSSACPADAVKPSSEVCRPSVSGCDAAETCDGSTGECPEDVLAAAGTTCRAADGDCDLEEVCDGTSGDCPSDTWVADETVCDDGDPSTSGTVCSEGICDCGGTDIDGDGLFDNCDDAEAVLSLRRLRVSRNGAGRWLADGSFRTGLLGSEDVFTAASGAMVTIEGSGGNGGTLAFAASDCRSRGRAIVCKNADRAQLRVVRTLKRGEPTGYQSFKVTARELDDAAPVGPISVTLDDGRIERVGTLSTCEGEGTSRLSCTAAEGDAPVGDFRYVANLGDGTCTRVGFGLDVQQSFSAGGAGLPVVIDGAEAPDDTAACPGDPGFATVIFEKDTPTNLAKFSGVKLVVRANLFAADGTTPSSAPASNCDLVPPYARFGLELLECSGESAWKAERIDVASWWPSGDATTDSNIYWGPTCQSRETAAPGRGVYAAQVDAEGYTTFSFNFDSRADACDNWWKDAGTYPMGSDCSGATTDADGFCDASVSANEGVCHFAKMPRRGRSFCKLRLKVNAGVAGGSEWIPTDAKLSIDVKSLEFTLPAAPEE